MQEWSIEISIPVFSKKSVSLYYLVKDEIMDNKITIRSDRKEDYTFQYKGEDVTLRAGSIVSIADGLSEVVFPTCVMKIVKNLIVIKDDAK